MQAHLNTAVNAAREAGKIILQYVGRLEKKHVEDKNRFDFVTVVDKQAEAIIVDMIKTAYPDHAILAEERGSEPAEDNTHLWVIDPLDGTTNYIHGIPHFAISIALFVKGQPKVAVVYDPIKDEIFTAMHGSGAFLNRVRMRVSPMTSLKGALIGTGFPYKNIDALPNYLKQLETIFPHIAGIRRTGSAALDLAYVASGRLDGFWEAGLKPWDVGAGILLVTEAGGVVSDYQGEDKAVTQGEVVAGSLRVHKGLLSLLADS